MRGDEKIVLTGRRAEGMQDQIKPHGELAETDPGKLNREMGLLSALPGGPFNRCQTPGRKVLNNLTSKIAYKGKP